MEYEESDTRPIAIFIPNLKGGGTQQAQILIARGLHNLGEPVQLVVGRKVGGLSETIPKEIEIVNLGGLSDLSLIFSLVGYLKREEPRAIICALNQANLLGLLAKRLSRAETRLVMVVQNHFGAKWKHQFTPTAPLRKWIFRHMYTRADAVVAVAEQLRGYLIAELGLSEQHVHAIPNPVDEHEVRMNAKKAVGHPWLQANHEVPVIITVGRLDYQKDHKALIRAFELVLKKERARLIIVGEGPLRAKLERFIRALGLEDYVDLVGFQSNPHAWMAKASLFVLSSRWEGYPLVLLEACALGLPVVSTDCNSGPAELLADGRFGKLVTCGDVPQLAHAILEALAESSKRVDLVDRASEFSLESVARRYTECFLRNSLM